MPWARADTQPMRARIDHFKSGAVFLPGPLCSALKSFSTRSARSTNRCLGWRIGSISCAARSECPSRFSTKTLPLSTPGIGTPVNMRRTPNAAAILQQSPFPVGANRIERRRFRSYVEREVAASAYNDGRYRLAVRHLARSLTIFPWVRFSQLRRLVHRVSMDAQRSSAGRQKFLNHTGNRASVANSVVRSAIFRIHLRHASYEDAWNRRLVRRNQLTIVAHD